MNILHSEPKQMLHISDRKCRLHNKFFSYQLEQAIICSRR